MSDISIRAPRITRPRWQSWRLVLGRCSAIPAYQMSEEQLKAFLEAVKADAGLQEKLKAANDADALAGAAAYSKDRCFQYVVDKQ